MAVSVSQQLFGNTEYLKLLRKIEEQKANLITALELLLSLQLQDFTISWGSLKAIFAI